MFKNKSWIVALFLAVTFILSGCLEALPSDDDDGGGAEGSYLMIANRRESWATIDLKLSEGNLDKLTSGKSHNVTFIGKANPSDSLNLGQGLAPYSGGSFVGDYTVPASGNFTISGDVAWADAQTQNVRLGVPQATDPFYVYDVILKDEDGKVIFQMSKDSVIQGMSQGEPFLLDDSAGQHAWLKKSGTPAITIVVPDAYNAVTGLDGVPEAWLFGVERELPLQPNPADFEGEVVWSIKDAGTTGATLTGTKGNILNTTAAGTVTLTATVAQGVSETEAWTKDYVIEVRGIVPANRIDFNINDAVIQGPASMINLVTYGGGTNKVEIVKADTTNFGFRFIQDITENYGPAAAFKIKFAEPPFTPVDGVITFPSLADFASISFTIITERGDIGWKPARIFAGTSLDDMVRIDTHDNGLNAVGGAGVHFHTYPLDVGLSAPFDGESELWLSIYINAEGEGGQNNGGSGNVPTSFIFGNISLNPREAIGSTLIATPRGWDFEYSGGTGDRNNTYTYTGSAIPAVINSATSDTGAVSNITYWSFDGTKYVGTTTAPTNAGNYGVTFNAAAGTTRRAVTGITVFNDPGAVFSNGRPINHIINKAASGASVAITPAGADLATWTLTANITLGTGAWSGGIPAGTTYRWLRNGVALTGAGTSGTVAAGAVAPIVLANAAITANGMYSIEIISTNHVTFEAKERLSPGPAANWVFTNLAGMTITTAGGGVSVAGNEVTFDIPSGNGGMFGFTFANIVAQGSSSGVTDFGFEEYANVEIVFELVEDNGPAQVKLSGKPAADTWSGATGYPQFEVGAEAGDTITYSHALTAFTTGSIGFQFNNDGGGNDGADFTILIKSVTFIPAL